MGEPEEGVDPGRPAAGLEPRDRGLRGSADLCELGLGQTELAAAVGHLPGDLGEEPAVLSAREPFPAFLYVYVDDADNTYRRAIDAGAVAIEEPLDTPYGDRRAMVRDPFGNVFQIAHRITAGT